MKTLRPLPLLLALLLDPVVAGGILGEFTFPNGDQIRGLSGMTIKDGRIALPAGELLEQATEIRLDRVLELRLEGGVLPVAGARHVAKLELTNGDTVHGQLAGLDQERVTFHAWHGGALRIKRSMCKLLTVQGVEPAVYVGPDALENWAASGGKEAWSVRGGEFAADRGGSIARAFELPGKCLLSFKLGWQDELAFRLLLHADQADIVGTENCYEATFQRRLAYLRKRWATGKSAGMEIIGRPAAIPEFAISKQADLDIFIDREAGRIALYVDGREASVWEDPDPAVGAFGKWIHLVCDDRPVRVSRIRMSAWTGDLPGVPGAGEVEPDAVGEEGLRNGEVDIHEVAAMENGDLLVRTKDGEARIPAGRELMIDFSTKGSSDLEKPRRLKGDVRAWWPDGGHITLQLRSLEEGVLTGFSQAYGEARLPLTALSRIEFNIYNEEFEDKRAQAGSPFP